jgi:hypothetical protein
VAGHAQASKFGAGERVARLGEYAGHQVGTADGSGTAMLDVPGKRADTEAHGSLSC